MSCTPGPLSVLWTRCLFVDADYGLSATRARRHRKDRSFRSLDDALTAAEDGDTILMMPGTHTMSSTPIVTKKVTIMGLGGAILKAGNGLNSPVIKVATDRVVIDGLVIDGNRANQSNAFAFGVWCQNAAWAVIRHCTIRDCYGHGVCVENFDGSVMADEGRILDCLIENNGGAGIAFRARGDTLQGVGDWTVHACHIDRNDSHGIHMALGSFNLVDGCHLLSNSGHGAFLEGVIGPILKGCLARNNSQAGIVVGSAGNPCQGARIEACEVHLNSRSGSGDWSGIENIESVSTSIIGCRSGDDFIGPIRQAYGIYLDANSELTSLVGNTSLDSANVAGGIRCDSSSFTAAGNWVDLI